MKTALLSLLTATLLGVASYASGRAFGATDITTILFTTGLVAWTIDQYSREPRSLSLNRPIQFPINLSSPAIATRAHRLAA